MVKLQIFVVRIALAVFAALLCKHKEAALPYRHKEQKAVECSRRQET